MTQCFHIPVLTQGEMERRWKGARATWWNFYHWYFDKSSSLKGRALFPDSQTSLRVFFSNNHRFTFPMTQSYCYRLKNEDSGEEENGEKSKERPVSLDSVNRAWKHQKVCETKEYRFKQGSFEWGFKLVSVQYQSQFHFSSSVCTILSWSVKGAGSSLLTFWSSI